MTALSSALHPSSALSHRLISTSCLLNHHHGHWLPKTVHDPQFRRSRMLRLRAAAREAGTEADVASPSTPSDAVNSGLSLFRKGRVRDALAQFDAALRMNPEFEEAQAALYNKACCHANREEGEQALDALRRALRDYDLKFSIILNDPDMAPLRAMPEFKQLLDEARKGGQDVGQGFRRDLKLIGEVQSPFRGVRKFFYVVFMAAAGVSGIINGPQLLWAIQGGENAPDLWKTLQNLGINIAGIIIFVALFKWDTQKEEEQIARISRDETLSRLPLRLKSNRIVELVRLRETTRPVILAGKKEAVTKAVQRAEKYRNDLIKRGVLLVPVVWSSNIEEQSVKRGFGAQGKAVAASTSAGDDFEARAKNITVRSVEQAEKSFKAEIISTNQWQQWIQEQQEVEGISPGEDVYIVLRLDGRIRKSGMGMPDWPELIQELHPLDALMSKLER